MSFCYYCGAKLGDDDAFCYECGKRVVTFTPEEPKSTSSVRESLAEKGSAQTMESACEPEERALTHKVRILGDLRQSLLIDERRITFVEGNGEVLYRVKGKREIIDQGFFSSGTVKAVYKIDDAKGSNVGEVEFMDPMDEESRRRTEFRKRLPPPPPKPPATGTLEKIARTWARPPREFDSWDFSPEPDFFGLSLFTHKTAATAGSYRAESEGKPLSFAPVRTAVSYKGAAVASIESEGSGYGIEYEDPEHVLATVMIFLALYVRL